MQSKKLESHNIAIILLNWNNFSDTEKCIHSIMRLNYTNYQVYVIDNGSTDGSQEQLAKIKKITLIKNDQNYGFAKGYNIGIKKILSKKEKPNYLWILNNDTILEENSLSELVKEAKKNNLTLTGSLLLQEDQKTIQCYAGGYFNKFLCKTNLIKEEKDLTKLEYICGASMLIRCKNIKEIGLFNENFFLYWEDYEFSIRATKLGYKIGCATKSLIYHKESATTSRISNNKFIHSLRSFIIFCRIEKKYLSLLQGTSLRILKGILCFKFKTDDIKSVAYSITKKIE
jgi:GT2 family glycosyltransferase